MEDNLSLVYVNPIGVNSDGRYEYDFYYSETPESVWGEYWNEQCPSICGEIPPEKDTYSLIERVISDIEIHCAQQNTCFSMQDCIDGCIALIWFYNNDRCFAVPFAEEYSQIETLISENNMDVKK